ncbi:peptidoglycan-binding protein [Thermomonospora cellulosilytica]|uniref:Peptidoglycan hydrolase-like protein with peptidoglycan-binding domain n=1 Tax=Thermomonospora cellulosilytica TaxID=1411118 RepID=A0A7W3N1N0_9ACTN|nr:peptidoglycan-binding protein [Thermomonospora cellulosilytica]MBA9005901.1 peptidoglycan hydrolase-like protein with peptidoglycan-binding domain [Thermomonospora cellulosilytica]
MGTAAGMLAAARADLGLAGRPNWITRSYSARHGDEYLRAAWCDMAITEWAIKSGNRAAVLPAGLDRAYTVWHAQDFQKIGRWHPGTVANLNRAKPGDIVFFDWGESDRISNIDHVGLIEAVLGGGRVQTIEGNTGDAVRRRVRSAAVIAGYGRPAYGTPDDDAEEPERPVERPGTTAPPWPGRYITQPPIMTGSDVRRWQARMSHRGWPITVDGAYGPRSEGICRAFQAEKDLQVDGVIGPETWRESWEAPIT